MRIFVSLWLLLASPLALAGPIVSDVWGGAAKLVCNQINKAARLYKQGDIKNAHLEAIMSYFKGYDASIEPAARTNLGAPHVFGIEQKFRDYATLMTSKMNTTQIKKVSDYAAKLCQSVNQDAAALNAAKVDKQVFKVG